MSLSCFPVQESYEAAKTVNRLAGDESSCEHCDFSPLETLCENKVKMVD